MKVMAAVDIADKSDQVVQAAARWAAKLGASLDLVYAASDIEGARDRLLVLRQDNIPEAIRGEARVLQGRPLDILPLATEGYDALLIATHGRPWFARAALGSVADRLVRTARCPVCVMPLHGRMEPGESERILVTTDRSLASVHAAQWGFALIKPKDVHVVHAVTGVPGPLVSALVDETTREIQDLFDNRDIRVDEVHVKTTGDLHPADTIVALAEQLSAGAILTAARGANAVPAMGMGSFTGRLLHLTKIPVWVLHG